MRVARDEPNRQKRDELAMQLNAPLVHSGVWAELQRELTGAEPLYLSIFDDRNERVGVSLAFLKRPTASRFGTWMKVLSFQSFPFCRCESAGDWNSVLHALEGFARETGAVEIEFGPYQSNCPRQIIESRNYDIQDYLEFPVALDPDQSELMAGLSSERRRTIRKAKKSGLTVEIRSSRDDLLLLHSLQQRTKVRAQSRGESFTGFQQSHLDAYEKLLSSNNATLFVASDNADPVSAALVLHFNRESHYLFGGTNEAGYKCGASPYVLWTALLHAKSIGSTKFNLGGVRGDMRDKSSPFFGLYRFKRGYGASEISAVGGRKTTRPFLSKVFYGGRRVSKLLGRN